MFNLTDDQSMIRNTISDFALNRIAPDAYSNDHNHRFPSELIKDLAELGFMGHFVPEQYGGSGFDYLSYVISIEEISKACASTGIIVSVNNSLVCSPIIDFGTEDQLRRRTGLVSTPSPSMRHCATSPSSITTAPGVPVLMMSPGNSVITCEWNATR